MAWTCLNVCSLEYSVAEHYPHFEERMRVALKSMLGVGIESRIKIGMAKDGSGVGGKSVS
jgi:hexokinase